MITSVQQSIIEVVAEILECEESDLSMEFSKEENDEWDSVNTLRMFTSLEAEFNVRLSMEQFLNVETIQDIVNLIEAEKYDH
ncbi:acyl carrier protein [Anaerobacillus sp. 1_MG-2023]|uniref:acyl carrier protein n=1 Tax=Anaerobacillus sp. 1_MG-2023 TaxID=3062655 RepID=UPI0026E11D09|nr:acyl carrier protein [Anaerobacillus sp. 1_MG-2023]MDO6657354.1 acyl carrier protein [Anaerobacillus sp. 1_MG-2023]